jgi:tetratricopeptide (TPR) repeat protein
MAYAMNFDAYKSMDVLEKAVAMDPSHFWAQMKYAELLYRLRALQRAEEETLRALDLAGDSWEEATARKQLQEIRRLFREGTQKPAWTKPLLPPLVVIAAMLLLLTVTNIWR